MALPLTGSGTEWVAWPFGRDATGACRREATAVRPGGHAFTGAQGETRSKRSTRRPPASLYRPATLVHLALMAAKKKPSPKKAVAASGAKGAPARPKGKLPKALAHAESALRAIALGYPESHEDFPWGERALKVKGKVFAFMYFSDNGLSLTTKLAQTQDIALSLPFAKPTGYGLGKSGWVTARFAPGETPPLGLLAAFIDESYRAVAPKKLVATLPVAGGDAAGAASEGRAAIVPPPANRPSRRRAVSKAASSPARTRSAKSPKRRSP